LQIDGSDKIDLMGDGAINVSIHFDRREARVNVWRRVLRDGCSGSGIMLKHLRIVFVFIRQRN